MKMVWVFGRDVPSFTDTLIGTSVPHDPAEPSSQVILGIAPMPIHEKSRKFCKEFMGREFKGLLLVDGQ